MATKIQLLRERLAALRENGAGAGWDCFFTEDMNDATKDLDDAQRCFKMARQVTSSVNKSYWLQMGALALGSAENLIESWEGDN